MPLNWYVNPDLPDTIINKQPSSVIAVLIVTHVTLVERVKRLHYVHNIDTFNAMSKGSKEALTILIVTHVTHVKRVERLHYVHKIDTFNAMSKGWKDYVMLKQGTYTFLLITFLIFNQFSVRKKVLESLDLDLPNHTIQGYIY